MSPNEISSGFNNILNFSSSESSDSESLLEEDLKSGENCINKQWEAIERTLYQEAGQQVTDPELLKECKLWRESFPHFRVIGTKIDLKQSDDTNEETEKSIQTIKNHFDFKKLEEKRESIKKKVVGDLVERLIAKYGFEKEESSEVGKNRNDGRQLIENDDKNSQKLSNLLENNNIQKEIKKNSATSTTVGTDKESYFERGKQKTQKTLLKDEGVTAEQMEENLYKIFNSWEEEYEIAKLPKRCDSKKINDPMRQNLTLQSSQSPTPLWFKPKKFIAPINSLSNIEKPYEVKNIIDKKYEGLIERIMERKFNEDNPTRHCRSSASRLEIKSYQESLEKLRRESGFNDYLKKKDLPKLNYFNNNWLKRSETNFLIEDNFFSKKTQNAKLKTKKSSNLCREKIQNKIEDQFLEDLRVELTSHYIKPTKKNGIVEEIGLQRPKPSVPVGGKSFKSSSCGDLPKKKKEMKSRELHCELKVGKSESNFKNHVKLNTNKGRKSNGNQNPLLPPIESGIICTEIKKMGSKNISRRY